MDWIAGPALVVIAFILVYVAAWFENRAKMPKRKEVPDDSLVAEAYSECDHCTHDYQRSQFRSYVDEQVKLILDAQKANAQEAERQIRQRLATWVQNRKLAREMGS